MRSKEGPGEGKSGPDRLRSRRTPTSARRGAEPALLRVEPVALMEGGSALLKFDLPPGSYATVVLREYMKPGAREGGLRGPEAARPIIRDLIDQNR